MSWSLLPLPLYFILPTEAKRLDRTWNTGKEPQVGDSGRCHPSAKCWNFSAHLPPLIPLTCERHPRIQFTWTVATWILWATAMHGFMLLLKYNVPHCEAYYTFRKALAWASLFDQTVTVYLIKVICFVFKNTFSWRMQFLICAINICSFFLSLMTLL